MFPFFFQSPAHFDFQGKDISTPFSGVKVEPCGFDGKIAPHEGVTIFPQNLDTGGAPMTLPYKIGNERVSEDFQRPQPGYYQPTAQQPMHQPQPQSQPMQQPVIHPAQFSVSANGQPLSQRPQQRPAVMQQQPLMQPAYNPAPWDEREDDADNTEFRQDPYAGYPDFPQEYRLRDEAQLAAVY